MKRALWIGAVLLSVTLGAGLAHANAPSPQAPCADKEEGDRCKLKPYYDGYCEPADQCSYDNYNNNCLECVDAPMGSCSASPSPVQAVFWFQALIAVIGLAFWRRSRRKR